MPHVLEILEADRIARQAAAREQYKVLIVRAEAGPTDADELREVMALLGVSLADAQRHRTVAEVHRELRRKLLTEEDAERLRSDAAEEAKAASAAARTAMTEAIAALPDDEIPHVLRSLHEAIAVRTHSPRLAQPLSDVLSRPMPCRVALDSAIHLHTEAMRGLSDLSHDYPALFGDPCPGPLRG